MSLPTPPGTSHRDKENRSLAAASGSRVVWSQHNQIHNITNIIQVPTSQDALNARPTKSILKWTPEVLQVPDRNEREVTPEPSSPLYDLHYLGSPIAQIIAAETSLKDLIGAYSVLAARLRGCLTTDTDPETSWPLLQPFRKNSESFIDSLCRDLGKALVDPVGEDAVAEQGSRKEQVMLPSPKSSPKKKKRGMTAEQVKYARDLCTTSHAALKLLVLVFTVPAVYTIFDAKQIGAVLTAVLAIPLAQELPTLNGRKTCALAIWLIQNQRLPSEILIPASPRIGYALRRGIEGELGKEGKKGSANDGLKAIHDLSLYQPSTFVPAFADILPSVLSNLTAPTLVLRLQACHALGGLAIGSFSIPTSHIHTRMASDIASFLKVIPASASPVKKTSPPTTPESPIVRTLRTTLQATDPQHVAQGPVWALSVLSSLTVLLGSMTCTDLKVSRIVSSLLALAMRHKKSTIRALACAAWRCATWTYVQPSLPSTDEESEDDFDLPAVKEKKVATREAFWKFVRSVLDMGAGISAVAAIVGDYTGEDDEFQRILVVLKSMVTKNAGNFMDTIRILRQLASLESSDNHWDSNNLLPRSLFSSNPGLLTADFNSLQYIVRTVLAECPGVEDVRSLTVEELAKEGVLPSLMDVWKDGVVAFDLDQECLEEVVAAWSALIKANIAVLNEDNNDESDATEIATNAVDVLMQVLQDPCIDWSSKVASTSTTPNGSRKSVAKTPSPALRLQLIHALWTDLRVIFPRAQLNVAAERFISCLMKNEEEFTESGENARMEWASLCVDVLLVCDSDAFKTFWGENIIDNVPEWEWNWSPEVRSSVWRIFAQGWMQDGDGIYTGLVVLLGVPFTNKSTWDLSSDEFDTWERLLDHGISKALDYGVDAIDFLEELAQTLAKSYDPTYTSATHIAELLMNHLDLYMVDARQVPETLMDFVNDTLRSSYPPDSQTRAQSDWLTNPLGRVIEKCPRELLSKLLETIQDGLCAWFSDECNAMPGDAFDSFLTLYETTMLSMQVLPASVETIQTFSPLLESIFWNRLHEPQSALVAFTEFWGRVCAASVPEDSWPLKIQEHYGIVPVPSQEENPHDAGSAPDDATVSIAGKLPEAEIAALSQSTSEEPRSSSALLREAHDPESDPISLSHPLVIFSAPSNPPSTPSTPTKLRARTVVPPTPPHKSPKAFRLMPDSPRSPSGTARQVPNAQYVSPLAHLTPSSSTSPRSPKRRKLDNKENESPLMASPVMQSFATKPGPSKRRLSDEDDEERSAKKLKPTANLVSPPHLASPACSVASSDTSEEEVARSLIPLEEEVGPFMARLLSTTPTLSRKRKGIFMEAVEVPTVRQVYGELKRSVSQTSLKASTSPARVVRQRRPSWKVIQQQPFYRKLAPKPADDLFSPVSADVQTFNSDDSLINGPSSDPATPLQLSSDDDPHIGQVTPHHLISPALRRMKQREDDPPSDDSTLSASPTKDALVRRLKRTGSIQQKKELSTL